MSRGELEMLLSVTLDEDFLWLELSQCTDQGPSLLTEAAVSKKDLRAWLGLQGPTVPAPSARVQTLTHPEKMEVGSVSHVGE